MRAPEESVFAEKRVGLGFLEPRERLQGAGFRVIVVAESESSALSPNTRSVFDGKSGQLFVGPGGCVMDIAGEGRQFFLRSGIFGSGCVEGGQSGIGLAAGLTGRRFRTRGFFLFVRRILREEVQAAGE